MYRCGKCKTYLSETGDCRCVHMDEAANGVMIAAAIVVLLALIVSLFV